MEPAEEREIFRVKLKLKWLPQPAAEALRRTIQWLLGFSQFNKFYNSLPPAGPFDRSRLVLDRLGIRLEIDGEPIDGIPASGPLIVVANHPSGMVDGPTIDLVVTPRRPDFVLMAVNNLASVPGIEGRMIFVGPRGREARRRHSIRGWRKAYAFLENGGALGIFPAGGVSRFTWRKLSICDPPWTSHVSALALRSRAAVLPLYFHARNRFYFHFIGALCKPLQDLMILGEMQKMRGKVLRVTVGKVILPEELAGFRNKEELTAFLRARVEALAR